MYFALVACLALYQEPGCPCEPGRLSFSGEGKGRSTPLCGAGREGKVLREGIAALRDEQESVRWETEEVAYRTSVSHKKRRHVRRRAGAL